MGRPFCQLEQLRAAGSSSRNIYREFRSLADPWADTGTSTERLMLAVLGGLADVERDLIRTRTPEGRSRAKAQGKHIGGPPSLLFSGLAQYRTLVHKPFGRYCSALGALFLHIAGIG
jgi:hypothetical protein